MSAVNGLVLVKNIWEQGGNQHMWTCHAKVDPPGSNTLFDMNALSSSVGGAMSDPSGWLPLMTVDATYIGAEVDDLSPTGFGSVMDNSFTAVGTDGAPATALSCITVTKLTGSAGRANRGRSFIGAMSYDRVTDEGTQWVTGFVAAVEALYQTFIGALADTDGASYIPVLYHRGSDTTTVISDVRANGEIYRQAKRVR